MVSEQAIGDLREALNVLFRFFPFSLIVARFLRIIIQSWDSHGRRSVVLKDGSPWPVLFNLLPRLQPSLRFDISFSTACPALVFNVKVILLKFMRFLLAFLQQVLFYSRRLATFFRVLVKELGLILRLG